ncbi:MAG: cob(I)yrinic acid a,c-diamide adenosyltransferase [Anaerolineaceae bacterium]|nr:cob(I)yrinic acid a,c-diamide adenosyltransferase [Anaerolineaceae bacterium]
MPRNTFYTRAGDEGYTGLLGSGKVPKEDIRLEAVGTVDEANAALGIARSLSRSPGAAETILQIQRDLYGLMAELAAAPENAARFRSIDIQRVTWLEGQVDSLTTQVEIPNEFIVPGDAVEGAFLDLARTVVRRAERRVADLLHRGDINNPELLRYLNRLSSYCFLLELRETLLSRQAPGEQAAKITLVKNG